jgi:hypothetical protein
LSAPVPTLLGALLPEALLPAALLPEALLPEALLPDVLLLGVSSLALRLGLLLADLGVEVTRVEAAAEPARLGSVNNEVYYF